MTNADKYIQKSVETKLAFLADGGARLVQQAADMMIGAIKSGHRIYLFGNGGSAADAQHIAGELVGRFQMERRAMPALALTTDTSVLTSVGNDYGFDECFTRQVEAFVQEDDVVVENQRRAEGDRHGAPDILERLPRRWREAARVARQLRRGGVGRCPGCGGRVRPGRGGPPPRVSARPHHHHHRPGDRP